MFWQSAEKKLYAAIEKGKEAKVKKYLAKCDTNVANEDGWSPLHAACFHGQLDVAKQLLLQADAAAIDLKDYTGRTPLYLASEAGKLELVKLLVANKVRGDIVTEGGMGPLHVASWNGHLAVVKVLVDHCDLNLKACLGSTPLDMAASRGKLDIVRLLVAKKVDVQAVNKNGWNALHSAAWWGQVDVVRFLMQFCDTELRTNAGNTALDLALEHRRIHVVVVLQEKEESSFSFLDAARLGRVHLVRKLAPTQAAMVNEHGWSALHIACSNGHEDVARVLLDYIDVNLQTKEGATPLYVAAGNGNLNVVKFLIERKANVALGHNSGWSPLHIACSKGHMGVINYLLQHIPIDIQTNHGSTPLHLASTYGKLDVVQRLIAQKANTKLVDTNGWSALHDACSNGHMEVVRYLIQYLDVNVKNNNGQTPLYLAAQNGKLEIVKFLLDKNAHVGAVSNNGWSPLHDASSNGHLEVVKVLVNYLDINLRTKDGATPLYVAAGTGKLAILNFLLDKKADMMLASNIGWTPLHSACYNGQLEVVRVLAKYMDLNMPTKTGTTPLYVAAGNGQLDVVQYLLSQNVGFRDFNGSTPLHRASSNGHLDIVKVFLDHMDINLRTKDGQTPLHKAAQHGKVNVVKYLLEKNAQVNTVSHSGWGPLHSACWGGHIDVVRLLVEHTDVDAQTKDGATPLYVAAGNGQLAIANFLLVKNANVVLPTTIGWSPLHVACSLGYFDIALSVAEYVNPRLTTSIRWNASKMAFGSGEVDVREAMAAKIAATLSMKRTVVERFHVPTKEPEDDDEWERDSELTTEGTMYSLDEDGFF
ncbi:Aste57867_430 [Aphanomyces stellatus]|uniref:Aste57867_430 protein n=1 Tax=Aphanomyces stellatus TaxID=120398 RepID=A0A485K2Z2_9STRA|nr:hypothetical protein As57867_000429 [Aphanomyces stellatus]VFT77655.1 Aste57867_430 [Aphanomyces stellatus]